MDFAYTCILEVWSWNVDWRVSSIFDRVICLPHIHIFISGQYLRVNSNRFSLNLVSALILCRFGLGLQMGKFCQFLTELSAFHTSVFSFLDNCLCKHQSIFTKLGMCMDIMKIWFGTANGQISSIFDRVICLPFLHTFQLILLIRKQVKKLYSYFLNQ